MKLSALLIKYIGISFQSWGFWSCSFLTQGHLKLEILLDKFTFFEPPCLILTWFEFEEKKFGSGSIFLLYEKKFLVFLLHL